MPSGPSTMVSAAYRILTPVFAQAVFVDGAVVAIAGEAVGFPADDSIEKVPVAVGDHLLEGRAVICLAGDVPVDVLLCDGHAVSAGIGFAIVALTLDALLCLAGAAGIAIVGHEPHSGRRRCFGFA